MATKLWIGDKIYLVDEEVYDEIERLSTEGAKKDATLADILRFIDAQAEDEGLWCEAQYASEAYIQRGLRGCHAYIESRIKDGPPASGK